MHPVWRLAYAEIAPELRTSPGPLTGVFNDAKLQASVLFASSLQPHGDTLEHVACHTCHHLSLKSF